jgi:hypothetical protein
MYELKSRLQALGERCASFKENMKIEELKLRVAIPPRRIYEAKPVG